ncbi:HTTM domain-containing protein [Lacinutrix sp. C3R15]|uniref:HTTM domain-containing protein n=1 Tax=Flavobacteriaceae TaxID=49546 RepID=UPI001C0A11CB|nr:MULTISPECIES: HTTM domain-containing protein [Flavobacteriaceae]MBU2938293.1 HTTM domain-containing protein [Lacinutrix sp. C3R15]MDO6621607.1 HTTM domain-containing protein [Oceanihabitans sp. 1_MG-2023]
MNKYLFKHIDNSALIVFRIFFGLLCFLESVGAIFTGWVTRAFIEPKFTFTFIGFEWLQPLPGNGMYFYYLVMGIFGFLIMIGYKYRFSTIMFTLMWLTTYLMQKASYNNHYYLLILLSAIMVFLPANKYHSVDAKQNPKIKSNAMPQWCRLVFILQMFIVYTYGSIAKLYPDWLDASVMKIFMSGKKNYFLIGEFLQQEWLHYFLAYGGILYDGLVVPFLLFKPTRKIAFFGSIFFHLFNSIVFQVGIFPYLALAFSLFFFNPKTIKNIFFKKKEFYDAAEIIEPKYKKPFVILFSIYFILQIALPLRHHFIKDNVLWTEEGHKMSWRMMLRSKLAHISFKVKEKGKNKTIFVKLEDYLSKKQMRLVSTHPDVMWQFAQRLKKEYNEKGKDVAVFISCNISVNGRPYTKYINSEVDIASVSWSAFKHSEWILPSKLD